jgi:hypothetical protein
MSLIHTAELAKIEPFDYLVALQRHAAAVLLEPAAWMPTRFVHAARATRLQSTSPALDFAPICTTL